MPEVDKETEKNIQELQVLEQTLQSVMMQRQAIQLELSEVENAIDEMKKTKANDEVFKISGQIMIKTSKEDVEKGLKEKCDFLATKLKSFDNQEKSLSKNADDIRKKVLGKIQK